MGEGPADGRVTTAACARHPDRGFSSSLSYPRPKARARACPPACSAYLIQLLLAGGRHFCTLFVDVANATAGELYGRIGYQPIAGFAAYRFDPPPA